MAVRWPETGVRNVRHELTAERKAEIAEAAKKKLPPVATLPSRLPLS